MPFVQTFAAFVVKCLHKEKYSTKNTKEFFNFKLIIKIQVNHLTISTYIKAVFSIMKSNCTVKRSLKFVKNLIRTLFVLFISINNVHAKDGEALPPSAVLVTSTTGSSTSASYTNLTAAFAAINNGVHTGVITVSISASTDEGTGSAVLNSSGAGSASYTSISIKPSADNISVSSNTVTGRGVIELNGADNVTIDGDNPNTSGTNRNLSVINTAANTVSYNACIRLVTSSAVLSCDNVTVKNCIITGNGTNMNTATANTTTGTENTSFGIYAGGNGGATTTADPLALNSVSANTIPAGSTINTLLIDNCSISSCARAISFIGAATTNSTGVTISNNTIGAAGTLTGNPPYTAITNTVYVKGILVQGTNAVSVTGNTIRNILSYAPVPMSAIELSSAIGSGTISIANNNINGVVQNANTPNTIRGIYLTAATGPYTISSNIITNIQLLGSANLSALEVTSSASSAIIEKNKISTVYSRNTGTYGTYGINLNGGLSITVRNNFIYDLNHDMTGGNSFSSIYGVFGIRLALGNSHKIYHNTVSLSGAMQGASSSTNLTAALVVLLATQRNIDIRNNIFSNTISGGTTGIAHVGICLPPGMTSTSNITINNNAYYCGTDATRQGIAFIGSTYSASSLYAASAFNASSTSPSTNLRSYTSTLTAAGTNDNASLASTSSAPFVSSADLHISTSSSLAINLESKGANVSVTSDIDGDSRGTTPDIGADEFSLPSCTGAAGGTVLATSSIICGSGSTTIASSGYSTGQGSTYSWESSTNNFTSNIVTTGQTNPLSFNTGTISTTMYYRLKVTCSASTSYSNIVTITVQPAQTAAINASATSVCQGTSVTLTENGGTASGWLWSPGGATTKSITVTPSSTTTYTVTASGAGGCSATAQSTITVNPLPANVSALSDQSTVCLGTAVNLSSSASSYNNTLLSQNFNAGLGTWTAVNNSVGGDDSTLSAWMLQPDQYLYSLTTFRSNDSSQFIMSNSDAQGNGTTSTILTSPAFSTVGYSAVSLGYYQYYRFGSEDSAVVEVSTDNTNWTAVKTYFSTQGSNSSFVNDNIDLTAYAGSPSLRIRFRYSASWDWYWCLDNITVTGTTSAFTYSWASNPSGFTSSLQNPANVVSSSTGNNTYTVTITNNYNCSSQSSAVVAVNAPAAVSAGNNQTICNTAAASLSGTISGGASTATWSSSGDGSFANANSLTTTYTPGANDKANGTVTLTLTTDDPAGPCTEAASSVIITISPLLTLNVSAGTINCNGGTATVTANGSGGTPPYKYSIGGSAFQTTNTATLPAGTYNVIVKDANNCTASSSVTVTQPPVLTASSSAGTINCNGGTTTVTVSTAGGTAPYTGTGIFTVGAGTYSYTVTDANGCTSATSITVTEPAVLVASSSAGTINCNGGTTTVLVSATGGTQPYTGTGIFTVGAGTYNYTITDANGCTSSTSITVTQPEILVASSTAGTIACSGGSTTITVSATGGTQPYTGTGTFTVTAGTYNYTVTDANGCTSTTTKTIANGTGTVPRTPGIISGPRNNVCGGTYTYSIASVRGATSYTWTVPTGWTITANNGTSITVSVPSNFNSGYVTVTANNNCGSSAPRSQLIYGKPSKPVISGPACASAGSQYVYTVTNAETNVLYTWTMPVGVTIVSGQGTSSVTIAWNRTTSAAISVTAKNTCGIAIKTSMTINICAAAVNASADNNVVIENVYPNPTNGIAHIIFTAKHSEKCRMEISEPAGKILQAKEFECMAGQNKINIDLTKYPSGTYLVRLICDEGTKVFTVVKGE